MAVGDSYVGSTSAELPPVVPGNYHVIVRTDIRTNVRESDDANNQRTSADVTAMDMPSAVRRLPETATKGHMPRK